MARSPSPLPGPILELSTENLHLNELSVDQLAALWNVFTKVGDSLHKGRRLENFVWRMWHREAHLLPPDSSWSDYADCTPLETPALSRAGSISQSYHFRPVMTQAIAAAAAAASSDNIPSDPEEGAGWSDESSDDDQPPTSRAESSKAISSRPQKSTERFKQVTATAAPPASQALPHSSPQSAVRPSSSKSSNNQPEVTSPAVIPSPSPLRSSRAGSLHLTAASSSTHPHERKRNSSASAAFGSRSRVRHLNPNTKAIRRRPISFQAALESLTNGTESDDLARLAREHRDRGMGAPHERRSYQGVTPIDILTPSGGEAGASSELQQRQAEAAAIAAATPSHSSAPATSTLDDQADVTGIMDSAATAQSISSSSIASPLDIQLKTTDAPSTLNSGQTGPADRHLEGAEATETDKKEKKKAKFFLSSSVSRSLGDDNVESLSAASVSPAPPHKQQPLSSTDDASLSKAEDKLVGPSTSSAAPSHKQPKSKSEDKQPAASGMASTHRNKSGAALHKHASGTTRARASHGHGHTHGHGHGRQGSSHRLTGLTGLTMTKTHPPVQQAPPAAKGAASTGKASTRSRPKFTMGDDGEDEDEFTDESNGEPEPASKVADSKGGEQTTHMLAGQSKASTHAEGQQPKPTQMSSQPQPEAKTTESATDDGDDEEGWSSDTSAEAEDERQRIAAEALRRRKAEEERQRDLFKKVPVRSASAADVRHLQSGSEGAAAPPSRSRTPQPAPDASADAAAAHPARGLLSSLFHPEQESRSPPGQLHGRPHASAADLRVKPDRPPSRAGHKSERRHRPPSLISGTPGAHHHHHQDESRGTNGDGSGSHDKKQTSSNDTGGGLRMSKSAVALPVLNTAASMTGGGSGELTSREESELMLHQQQQQQQQQEQHVSQGEPHRQSMRRGHSSQGSDVQQAPPVAMPAPTLAPHRAGLPTPAAPQTPRTTRRNMLRDELSESLRQNLLWERQSRNRMLGIGANGPREGGPQQSASQAPAQSGSGAPRPARRETVLGGNQLRPLTRAPPPSTSATTKSGSAGDDHRGASTTTTRGARGEHSRSTSHLADMSSQRGRDDGHSRGGSRSGSGGSHARPSSQPYGETVSAETSEEEEEEIRKRQESSGDNDDDSSDDGYSGRRRAASPGVIGNSSMTSSGSTSTLMPSQQHQQQPKQKKKTMWPGGFPNYHQHGW